MWTSYGPIDLYLPLLLFASGRAPPLQAHTAHPSLYFLAVNDYYETFDKGFRIQPNTRTMRGIQDTRTQEGWATL